MILKLYLLIVILFCSSCVNNTVYNSSTNADSFPDYIKHCKLEKQIPIGWRQDSLGCDNFRAQMLLDLDSINMKEYSLACIYRSLGQPNVIWQDSNSDILEYYIRDSCNEEFWGNRASLVIEFRDSLVFSKSITVE